jgi:hypothetical protein
MSGLVGFVAICAIGFGCLLYASSPLASTIYSITPAVLTAGWLGIIYRRGARRAFWVGFSLFGWSYLILAYGPWFESAVSPHLASTRLLQWAYPTMIPQARRTTSTRPLTETFVILTPEVAGDFGTELSGRLVDVLAKDAGKESTSLLAEGVRLNGGTNIGSIVTRLRVEVEPGLAAILKKAEADKIKFVVRPHLEDPFAVALSNPPVQLPHFEQVGHALFGLICAFAGGFLGRYFYTTGDPQTPSDRASRG